MKKDVSVDAQTKLKNFVTRHMFTIGLVMFVGAASFGVFYSLANNRKPAPKKCLVEACVSLYTQSADPTVITVTSGSYVQFNSADGKKHNIALAHSGTQHDDASEYESGDFGAGEAFKVQFKKDGAYTFRDKFNDAISVNVVVYTAGKDYKIQ